MSIGPFREWLREAELNEARNKISMVFELIIDGEVIVTHENPDTIENKINSKKYQDKTFKVVRKYKGEIDDVTNLFRSKKKYK